MEKYSGNFKEIKIFVIGRCSFVLYHDFNDNYYISISHLARYLKIRPNLASQFNKTLADTYLVIKGSLGAPMYGRRLLKVASIINMIEHEKNIEPLNKYFNEKVNINYLLKELHEECIKCVKKYESGELEQEEKAKEIIEDSKLKEILEIVKSQKSMFGILKRIETKMNSRFATIREEVRSLERKMISSNNSLHKQIGEIDAMVENLHDEKELDIEDVKEVFDTFNIICLSKEGE